MITNDFSLNEYVENATDAVKECICNLSDVEIDAFSDSGSNGYVLFGSHTIFRSRVAIKFYCYGETAHEEVCLIKQIFNDNLLKVWDAHAIKDGWAYFITDELHNGNLDATLQKSISTNLAISITRGIVSGIGALHASPNYLLHRDIKPANILMTENMDPVIADFGSIKRIPNNSTCVNGSKHSALYRPPESYEDDVYFCSSDIYQAGLIMYQLLGGALPYDTMHYMNKKEMAKHATLTNGFEKSKYEDEVIYLRAKTGKLIDVTSLPYYTDKRLISIIRKATHPRHELRYQNTADFLLALHKLRTFTNWEKESECLRCELGDTSYKICINKSGKYQIEKSNLAGVWSKLRSSKTHLTENLAIDELLKKIANDCT
jgi:eukaryotic-like serine/threonine-protein kinase